MPCLPGNITHGDVGIPGKAAWTLPESSRPKSCPPSVLEHMTAGCSRRKWKSVVKRETLLPRAERKKKKKTNKKQSLSPWAWGFSAAGDRAPGSTQGHGQGQSQTCGAGGQQRRREAGEGWRVSEKEGIAP